MGYEILNQPQIFNKPISALGGIFPYVNYPTYLTSFISWSATTTTSTSVFNIPGTFPILEYPESFLVNVGGIIQAPNSYTVNRDFRTITLSQPVLSSVSVYFTQIGTIALSTANFVNLTATNASITNALITNLTATSVDQFIVEANSSTDAVRITQTGSGNALLVEDSGNPDSSPFVIKSDGNVGIGTLSPTSKLTVQGNIASQSGWFGNTELNDYILVDPANDSFSFTSNSNERFRITSSGNVGINTSTPSAKLDVIDNSTTPAVQVTQSGTGPALKVNDVGGDITPFVITSAGRVGIGTEYPGAGLHIKGSAVNDNSVILDVAGTNAPTLNFNLPKSTGSVNTSINAYDTDNDYLQSASRSSHNISFVKEASNVATYYWNITTTTSPTAAFTITGTNNLQANSGAYLVTVGGLIQPPDSYTITSSPRRITFADPISGVKDIYIFQTNRPSLSTDYTNTSYTFWSVVSTVAATTYPLAGTIPLSSGTAQYFVGVDGVLQLPDAYSVNTSARTITFTSSVPPSALVTVAFLPSATSTAGALSGALFASTFAYWTTSAPFPVTTFSLTGTQTLLTEENCYLVNVGGILQTPTTYSIDGVGRRITFSDIVPSNTPIGVVQLAAPYWPTYYNTQFATSLGGSSTAAPPTIMTLKGQTGNVGIGTAAPAEKLTVSGNISASGVIKAANTWPNSSYFILTADGPLTTGAVIMPVASGGGLVLQPDRIYEATFTSVTSSYGAVNSFTNAISFSGNKTFTIINGYLVSTGTFSPDNYIAIDFRNYGTNTSFHTGVLPNPNTAQATYTLVTRMSAADTTTVVLSVSSNNQFIPRKTSRLVYNVLG